MGPTRSLERQRVHGSGGRAADSVTEGMLRSLEVSNELLIIAARRCTFKVVKKSLLSMSDEEAG